MELLIPTGADGLAPALGIAELLVRHRMLPGASSPAAACEAIAKLHGLVPPDAFPLQSAPGTRGRKFGDASLLAAFGLQSRDGVYSPLQAIDLIMRETREGRFPLALIFSGLIDGAQYWHVCLCARHNSSPHLVNLGVARLEASGRAAIKRQLIRTALATQGRKGIHVVTYRLPAQARSVRTGLPPESRDSS